MSDFQISTFDYNQTSSTVLTFRVSTYVLWNQNFVLSLVLKLSKMVIPPEKAIFYAGKSTPINFPLVPRLRAIFVMYPIR